MCDEENIRIDRFLLYFPLDIIIILNRELYSIKEGNRST